MSYYPILQTLNALCVREGWQLKRCRRQADDQLRYYLKDSNGHAVMNGHLRMGYLLPDVLAWVAEHTSGAAQLKAENLFLQLHSDGELYYWHSSPPGAMSALPDPNVVVPAHL